MAEHFCSACGQEHITGKSPEVRIAEINAERDVQIARMEYREAQQLAAVEAETAVVVTELETAAEVAVAEETDPPAQDDGEDGNQAIIVEGPPAEPAEEEPAPTLEPKEEHLPDGEPEHKRKVSAYWGQ